MWLSKRAKRVGEDRVETPLGGEGSQEEREGEELGSKTV